MTATQYWTEYFERVTTGGPAWFDYSNERVQMQTFGTVIEVLDSLLDRRVLDIGCGRGHLCRLAKVLGAGEVTGIDLAPSAVAKLAHDHPDLSWRAGDITDAAFRAELGTFDVICALESMQYLPVPTVLDWICEMLAPGGRFVAMFPFDGCPIVQRTHARFEGRYVPPSLDAVVAWATAASGIRWGVRGLRFQQDQLVCPYEVTPWTTQPQWTDAPNRIQLVVQKVGNG